LFDEEWLRDTGGRGWIVLMNDAKIRYRPAELQVLIESKLRGNKTIVVGIHSPSSPARAATPT
jgi:PIN like domain